MRIPTFLAPKRSWAGLRESVIDSPYLHMTNGNPLPQARSGAQSPDVPGLARSELHSLVSRLPSKSRDATQ